MATAAQCLDDTLPRRRSFWTTQPDACGTYKDCKDAECGIPGLKYIDETSGRTIATNDWLSSLVLNILNTKARTPSQARCNPTIAGMGGHWSESYRDDGLYIGTLIWAEMKYPASRIQDAVKLLNAQLNKDLSKLLQMGVATEVKVETTYKGSNRVEATISITGTAHGETILNLTSERVSSNGWVWR